MAAPKLCDEIVGTNQRIDLDDKLLHKQAKDVHQALKNVRHEIGHARPYIVHAVCDVFVCAGKVEQCAHQHADQRNHQQDGVGIHGNVKPLLRTGGRRCSGHELCNQTGCKSCQLVANTGQRIAELVQRTLRNGRDLLPLFIRARLPEVGSCPEAQLFQIAVFQRVGKGLDGTDRVGLDVLLDALPAIFQLGAQLSGQQLSGTGILRTGILNGLDRGLHTVGGLGGHGLDGALYSLDDLGAGAGSHGGHLLAAISQGLGGLFHRDLRTAHDAGLGVLDRGLYGRLDILHGLLDSLGAVRSNLCDGLDILQHTIHHLPGSLGDGLFLLLFAVGQGLIDRFHRPGHAVLYGGRGVRDGFDHRGSGLLGGLCGLTRIVCDDAGCVRGCGCSSFGRGLFLLRLLHTFIVEGLALSSSFIALGLVIVVHIAVVGCIIGFLCRTDTVFQVGQRGGGTLDLGDQLIEPVHHRTDGILCYLFDSRKCGVDRIAEGLAGLIGRHETCRKSSQQRHHQTDGICGEDCIQARLRDLKAGRARFGGCMGGGHGRGVGGVGDLGGGGKSHIALIREECRARSGDHRRGNADGVLELRHFLVAVKEGCHHLVELDHQLSQSRKQAAGQLTGQGADIILQGGHAPAEGLACFQHAVVELPALAGGGRNGGLQLAETDLAVRDALVQVGHALAGGITDLVQRVKARIDHHVDVFQRDLLCAGHLAVGAYQRLQFVRVAEGDVAKLFQHAGGVVCGNAELQQGLCALGQVGQSKGRGRCNLTQLGKLFGRKLFVAQHDLEIGQVAFHAGIVVNAAFDHFAQFRRSFLRKVSNHVSGGNGPFAGALFRRVTVEPYFAGDAEICHVPTSLNSKRARAQGHRLL